MNFSKPNLLLACLALALPLPPCAASALSPEARSTEFSLGRGGLALDGYDPVSYFTGQPAKGKKGINADYQGVTYRFESEESRATFLSDPAKYEPQYGGWCAWAMYDGGDRVRPNPERFKIIDGKVYLFYDGLWGDTLDKWNKEADQSSEAALIREADKYWQEQLD